MALKSRSKVDPTFNMSSMTDIVFLLLIFFMVTSTMIAPNALKLLLPKSGHQTSAKAITAVSIDRKKNFYIGTTRVRFSRLEARLRSKLAGQKEPTISLHADKSVPVDYIVKVMNIAKSNKYKLILATTAN